MNDGWGISCKRAFRRMSMDLTVKKSTLVQVMAWCCQATSHYLRQCWPRSMLLWNSFFILSTIIVHRRSLYFFLLPYGITRSQWVKRAPWCIASANPPAAVADESWASGVFHAMVEVLWGWGFGSARLEPRTQRGSDVREDGRKSASNWAERMNDKIFTKFTVKTLT